MAKVLVIDDEALLTDMFRATLGKLGHHVVAATNGLDGLEKFQQSHFDLVLMDYKMPGKNGIQTLKELRAIAPETPTVMLSAWGTSVVENQARQLGVREFLSKNLSLDVILNCLTRILQSTTVPKTQPNAVPEAVSGLSTSHAETTPQLLIVDDEPLIGEMLSRYFSKRGYRVSCAANQEEALSLAMRERPNVIILDMYMPGSLGLEVLQSLRAREYHAPVIVLSASQDERLLQACLDAGVLDVMPKPVSFDKLELAVNVATVLGEDVRSK